MGDNKQRTLLTVLDGRPSQIALYCANGGPRLTFGQLSAQVKATAEVLRSSGIQPGDTVSIADTNTVGVATSRLDATGDPHPLNTRTLYRTANRSRRIAPRALWCTSAHVTA